MASRNDGQDPYNYCLPGGPLRITGGFAWRLVQHPDGQRDAHLHAAGRERPHVPADLHGRPHASGRSEPDLVRPFDRPLGRRHTRRRHHRSQRRFWLDASGIQHTEQLHMVERWTRTNLTTMRREVTIEDPGRIHPAIHGDLHRASRRTRERNHGIHLHREQPIRARAGPSANARRRTS